MDASPEHQLECQIEAFDEDQIGEDIVTLEGAAEALAESIRKVESLGERRLKKATGKWHTARTETLVRIADSDD